MIHRDRGTIIFECDACDETLDTGEDDFPHAHAQFRLGGWRAEKVGDEWTHLCPACRKIR